MSRVLECFRGCRIIGALLVVGLLCVAGSAWAGQQTQEATIFGLVTDESGAVLPGVTVTVTSPQLIVKEMVAVTDTHGEYRVTPLPLGTYNVEFTLAGFQGQRREGVRLTAGFVAKIDVQLKVGSVEETITVSGQSPVVDVKTTSAGTQVTRDKLDALPTGRNGFGSLLTLAAGAKPSADFGQVSAVDPQFRAFGRPQNAWIVVEGVATTSQFYGQSGYSNSFSYESIEEAGVTTLGSAAEAPTSGVQLNVIMKSGGNDFHGSGLVGQFASWMQANNIDDELRAQNINAPNNTLTRWDRGGDLGGRIARDKTWFYSAFRVRRDATANLEAFLADGSPSARRTDKYYLVGKVTQQLNSNQKLIGSYQWEDRKAENGPDRFVAPETTTRSELFGHLGKGEWQLARGNKYLSVVGGKWVSTGPPQDVLSDIPSWKESSSSVLQASGYNTGGASAVNRGGQATDLRRTEFKATLNWYKPGFYKGNHDFKMGANYYVASADFSTSDRGAAGNYQLIFKAEKADTVDIGNNPVTPLTRLDYIGMFFQDSWAVNHRLTLNLGVRYANDRAWLPDQCRVAAPAPFQDLYPAQCFARYNAKTWNPLAPRLHAAYDITGDGKTVVKGGWGRFWTLHTQDEMNLANENANSLTTFKWKDNNNNRRWDVGESNLDPNGSDFQKRARSINANLSGLIDNPNLNLPGSDEYTISVERQLMADVGLRVSGIYSKNFNTVRVQNIKRPFESYNVPFTNPDPGPDGKAGTADDPGVNITVFDYPASLSGAANQVLQLFNYDPSNADYKSFEFAVDKRLSHNWQMFFSYSLTQINVPNVYETIGSTASGEQRGFFSSSFNPNQDINTSQHTKEWMTRVGGAYHFPFDVLASVNVSYENGEPWARTVQFSTPVSGNITVRAEPIGTQELPNPLLVGFRAEKGFRLRGGHRLSVAANVINLLNANFVTAGSAFPYNPGLTIASGATYKQASAIAFPRIGEAVFKYTF